MVEFKYDFKKKDYLGLIVQRKKKYKTHHTNAWNEMKESQEQCCLLHESVTVKIRDNPPLFFNKCAWKYFHLETSRRHTVRYFMFNKNNNIFFSQFFFIKYYMMRLLKYIELATFYWNLSQSEKLSWDFNKNTDKQNRCAISSHKLKIQRICY